MGRAPARPLPHHDVQARLGISAIHGIGAFAIRAIAVGTPLFANDAIEIVWISRSELDAAGLTAEQARLYHDFCIFQGDRVGCPVSFDNLTPGWYLNQPAPGEAANVAVDAALNFTAARDIAEGDELTVRYADFSKF